MQSDEDGFDHHTRKRIFDFLSSNPGSSIIFISKGLKSNSSTLKYHLNQLEKHGLISSKKKGKKRCYYCSKHQAIDLFPGADVNIQELPRKQQRILEIIRKSPGITQKDLTKRTKFSQQTVSYNLNRLIELQQIWKIIQNGEVRYEIITKDAIKNEIIDRLIVKLHRDEIDQETFRKLIERLDSID